MPSSVSRAILKSFLLAPSMARPTGTPLASTRMLRLVPSLALSVGLGPVFFPSQGSLGHRSVHGEPFPVDAFQLVIGQEASSPKFQEDARLQPLLEAPVGRGARTNSRGVQSVPLAPGAEHKENGIHRRSVWNSRIVATERVRGTRRQQWLHQRPQFVGNFPAVVFPK